MRELKLSVTFTDDGEGGFTSVAELEFRNGAAPNPLEVRGLFDALTSHEVRESMLKTPVRDTSNTAAVA